MKMVSVEGRKIANQIIGLLKKRPRPAGALAAVLVGRDPSSISFLKQKAKIAKRLGVTFELYKYPVTISQKRLEAEVVKLGRKKRVRGIIIQLPLPLHIHSQAVLERVPLSKDVDVLSSAALGKFATKQGLVLPPVAGAIEVIAQEYGIRLKGKDAAVIGSGRLVGLPTAIWLVHQGSTVYFLNEATKNFSRFTKKADIIICGTGKPGLLKGAMVKRGVLVFDAGYAIKNGKPAGDCEFNSVSKKARLVTPVPGGIGPLTVAMLFKNFYDLDRSDNL